jgi:hypothetical protein
MEDFFSLSRKRLVCFSVISGEKFDYMVGGLLDLQQASAHRKDTFDYCTTRYRRQSRLFAPACTHNSASYLLSLSRSATWVVAPWKHLAFLSFQCSQAISTKMESAPRRHCPVHYSLQTFHRSRVELVCASWCVSRSAD